MPLFGSHLSVAGGLHKAALAAKGYGFDCVQIFTKSPNQWASKPLSDEEAAKFRDTMRECKLKCSVVHDSYLINLASPDETLWRKSVEAFVDEVRRAEQVGAAFLVTHPGACVDSDEEIAIAKVATALDEVHERCSDVRVKILIETTAGQGTTLGHAFEHLAAIIGGVSEPDRLGVCFDSCHVFAAGYALAPDDDYQKTMKHFDRVVGVKRIHAFHLNDSKKPQGSRVDRHEHIGRGFLGLEPFRLLVNDRRFKKTPMILETAKEIDPQLGDMDALNLATLRGLMGKRNE